MVETGLPNRRITTGRQVCHPDSEKALDLSRAVSAPKPAFSIEIDLVGNKYRVTLDDGAPRRARCQCRFSPAELSDIYKSLCKRPEAVMADTTVDVGAVFGGIFLPGSVSDRVAKAYDEVLFKGAMLRDLPDDSEKKAPRFVINATNVQTAALWRFSRPYMGDYRVGLVDAPDVRLCSAVAASSAFRPILSPMTLPITQPVRATKGADLNRPPYTIQAVLSDGGVYDNLGLETVKRLSTLLVSDAGQKIASEESPQHDWPRHALRVLDTIDNQVRSLRKRHLIESYKRGDRTGAFWGIRTNFADYKLATDPLKCLIKNPVPLAEVPTRLEKMPRGLQDRLINWGYAICDAALRAHVDSALQTKLGIQIAETNKFPFAGEY